MKKIGFFKNNKNFKTIIEKNKAHIIVSLAASLIFAIASAAIITAVLTTLTLKIQKIKNLDLYKKILLVSAITICFGGSLFIISFTLIFFSKKRKKDFSEGEDIVKNEKEVKKKINENFKPSSYSKKELSKNICLKEVLKFIQNNKKVEIDFHREENTDYYEYNEILPNLYLGGSFIPKTIRKYDGKVEKFKKNDFDLMVVLNKKVSLNGYFPAENKKEGAKCYDDFPINSSKNIGVESFIERDQKYLQEALLEIDKALVENKKVLVFCMNGIDRSPTVIAAYIISKLCQKGDKKTDMLVYGVLNFIISKRHLVNLRNFSAKKYDRFLKKEFNPVNFS